MSKKYEPKRSTGREYVDKTTEFSSYITMCMLHMPEEWEPWITGPIVKTVQKIADLTTLANRVYINDKRQDVDTCIQAYEKRDEYLYEALRHFAVFDTRFEEMTDHIDIAGDEIRRLKAEIYKMIDDLRKEDPSLTEIKIKVSAHKDSFEYTAMDKSIHTKIAFNSDKRKHSLELRNVSEDFIKRRITLDRTAIIKLATESTGKGASTDTSKGKKP